MDRPEGVIGYVVVCREKRNAPWTLVDGRFGLLEDAQAFVRDTRSLNMRFAVATIHLLPTVVEVTDA